MQAGVWTHQQLVTDAFSFDDLIEAHEFLDVKLENERRAEAYQRANNPHGT